ncbi:MAG: transcriptional regulator [Promethearchaeati archaeon SRVP18_Atabeyarchaeia-1]
MGISLETPDPAIRVADLLRQARFQVSDIHGSRSACFDIVARKSNVVLLLKVLSNIDSMQEKHAFQLKLLSYILSASMVLVGERTRKGKVEDDALYERHGIPAVSYNTLRAALLRNIFPVVYATRGGFYVHLDGDRIRKEREKWSFSLGALAESLGVSRRSIYEYERNGMDSTLETALRLEELFSTSMTIPFDILSCNAEGGSQVDGSIGGPLEDELEENVSRVLSDLGLKVVWSRGTPFDAITYTQQKNNVVVTGVGYVSERRVQNRIQAVGSFSSVVRSLAMFILDRPRSSLVEGVPVVSTDELESMDDASELLKTISIRTRRIVQ